MAGMSTIRAGSTSKRALARRLDRCRLEIAIAAARELVERDTPFSPSWDAAMAALEDLQGQSRPEAGGFSSSEGRRPSPTL
jgi:hypothetical protein